MALNKKGKTSPPKTTTKARKVKQPSYKSFKLSKRIRHVSARLPKARHILRSSLSHLVANKKLYAGLAAVYFLLALVLVKGLGFGLDSEVTEIKDILDEALVGQSSLVTGTAVFGFLLGSAGSAGSEISSLYQTMLLVLISLAVIWALRQTHAGKKPSVKDAFYKGMYPLIPFLLVMLVILLQLLPLVVGNLLYSIVLTNGLAVTGVEQVVWALLFGLLALLSVYMVVSSVFALFIVTLPDVTPLQALRSARELVQHRRVLIGRKLLFLPFILLVAIALIMLPIIIYLTALAEFVFFVLTVISVIVTYAYVYELYRKLL